MTSNSGTIPNGPEKSGAQIIREYAANLPSKCGVYRMFGVNNAVLYVGKAKNLRARVSSYGKPGNQSNRILRMINETRGMEFVITETETEALLLEANLIKQLRPRYNVILRDDKSFPFILVAEDHEAPQILKHRGGQKRKGSYYGPFASAGAVNRTLNTLQKAFLLRSCTDNVYHSRTRPCLLHQIKRCSAPCVDLIDPIEYRALVSEAKRFLSGRHAEIQRELSVQMDVAAKNLDFELAAGLRDRIRALSYVQGGQDINSATIDKADLFALHMDGVHACVQVFFYRSGQNWGNHAFYLKPNRDQAAGETLESFIAQFYDSREPPPLILVSEDMPQGDLLQDALTMKTGKKVSLHLPRRGEKSALMSAALMNAKEALARRVSESAQQRENLEALARVFDLDAAPERIEVFDNSHIQGSNAVGGMIVAGLDGFLKSQYRKFNIKSTDLTPGDDYAMMREVVKRRFSRMLKNDAAEQPNLVIIDGGKGHLTAALNVFDELGINLDSEGIHLACISKARRNTGFGQRRIDRTMSAVSDQVYMPGKNAFLLPPRDAGLFYLQKLRDEAHRFAIGTHRAKRGKTINANPLDEIPGVGAKRKRALLNHFGSARAIAHAKPEDIASVHGVSKTLAQSIYDFFHGE